MNTNNISHSRHQSKDQGKKRNKKKRNILRDPNDKRAGIKTKSTVYRNNSKKRGDLKISYDAKLNWHNPHQVNRKEQFYFKDDGGNIVVMTSNNKYNDRSAVVSGQFKNRRNNLFEGQDMQK